jgi:uncharacterized protein YjbJ (UPF0337 family)
METEMDKDRIKGAATNLKGKAKEVAGKMTGDAKLKTEGKADQVAGTYKMPWVAPKMRSAMLSERHNGSRQTRSAPTE